MMLGFMAGLMEVANAKQHKIEENTTRTKVYHPSHAVCLCKHKTLNCVFITALTKYATKAFYPLSVARGVLKRRLLTRVTDNASIKGIAVGEYIRTNKLTPVEKDHTWLDDWEFEMIYNGDSREESVNIANALIQKYELQGEVMVLNAKATS